MAKASQKEVTTKKGEVVKAAPTAPMPGIFEEMDRMMERFFPRGWLRPFRWEWPAWGEMPLPFEGRTPRVDVIDREDEVVVRAEVPGVSKDQLDVSVTEDTVTIRGETRREQEEEKGDYYRCEITHGAFSRTVPLPAGVDADKAKATFRDGILELRMPKLERARRHNIPVQ